VDNSKNVKVVAVETQTELTNLHSESICCLSHIPYADMTNSPPPPSPRVRITSRAQHSSKNHPDESIIDVNASAAEVIKVDAANMNDYGGYSGNHIDSDKVSNEEL
jgi:hypothetical protein